ncbi:MAG: type II secretion system GspH family protein [Candidatus Omnitrophica bacterium]|nr:type II secretion system GspH family protein [Candidatus Omnitrophota bacterium]MBU4467697.1 type II secretion system GspH family protein [Candidatus Omnitrophota bacterium]MCG2708012.1 type II secretion system GspH family protein [Candidatus Omnitrophota bacterium]
MSKLKGFTLVEIMISVLILGVGLTLVANSYLVALKGVNTAASNIEALNLAKEKLEALEVLSLKDGLLASHTSETLKTPVKNYDFTQAVVEITQPKVLAEHLVQACITLNWQEQNSVKNVTFSTYLSKQKK